MSDNFTHMMQELAGIMKVGHFAMDSQTQCTLNVDTFKVLIQYLSEADQVLMACELCPVPGPDSSVAREALYGSLLRGQFLFKQTAGATFAVDPENSFVILQLVRGMAGLSKDSLFSVLEAFINVAEFWRSKLESELEVCEDAPLDVPEVLASYIKV